MIYVPSLTLISITPESESTSASIILFSSKKESRSSRIMSRVSDEFLWYSSRVRFFTSSGMVDPSVDAVIALKRFQVGRRTRSTG